MKWYKIIPLKMPLDDLLVWARLTQLNTPCYKTTASTGNNQVTWLNNAPRELWFEANEIFPCLDYWGSESSTIAQEHGPRVCSVWEYHTGAELSPHIDNISGVGGYPGVTSMIIPLIGGFTTSIYTDHTCTEIADSVTYYPGNIFVMRNWEMYHSGKPLSGYRLCLHIFSESGCESQVESIFRD
jgi:hypothetical protein